MRGEILAYHLGRRYIALVGGPPCQGFSNLGTKHPDDPRNRLWKEYLRVVVAANPQVFVLENVDRLDVARYARRCRRRAAR